VGNLLHKIIFILVSSTYIFASLFRLNKLFNLLSFGERVQVN